MIDSSDGSMEPTIDLALNETVDIGGYRWIEEADVDGTGTPVKSFYTSDVSGVSLYFCYNIPSGSQDIVHDPSFEVYTTEISNIIMPITPEPDIIIPLPPEIEDIPRALYGVFIVIGISAAVGAAGITMGVKGRRRDDDILDLENNHYFKK